MPIKFRHRKISGFPDTKKIENPELRRFAEGINRLIEDTFKNIYDDIHQQAYAEMTTALPTASIDYQGKLFLHNDGTSSSADTLRMCIDTGSAGYAWRTVTLT